MQSRASLAVLKKSPLDVTYSRQSWKCSIQGPWKVYWLSASQCGMETAPIRAAKFCRELCRDSLAERISGSALPFLQDIYLKRCKSRAAKIIKDSNHPGNRLFILLLSGKRFRSMMAKTERLGRSFFPQAIRLLNSNSVSKHLHDSI